MSKVYERAEKIVPDCWVCVMRDLLFWKWYGNPIASDGLEVLKIIQLEVDSEGTLFCDKKILLWNKYVKKWILLLLLMEMSSKYKVNVLLIDQELYVASDELVLITIHSWVEGEIIGVYYVFFVSLVGGPFRLG